MGLFDGLKHLFNIGGATFEVALEHDVQYQGSTISGEITVTGGSISQDVNVLTIDLVEYWTETRGHGKNRRTVTVTDVHATEELEHHFTIEAGSSQVFQFTHQLPPTARLSTGRTGWRLVLNADVSGGIDPCHTTTLEVEPAAQILRVGDVLESRLRFSEQVAKRHWYVGSRMTRMRFLPPESIRPHLDYLQLELQLDYDGNLSGELRFDLQERLGATSKAPRSWS